MREFTKTTSELLKILQSEKNVNHYLHENTNEFLYQDLSAFLNQILIEKNIRKSDIVKLSGLDRIYVYQIFNGQKKNPSRDKILAIGIAMSLSVDEIQAILKYLKYPLLYPRDTRDSVILFSIFRHKNVMRINELLVELNFPLLM